ncbi:hypothetical protein MRX96_055177 [Rhipicephalus microplus]
MLSRGVVPRSGLNKGAPKANAQLGRGRGSRHQQLRNKVDSPKPPLRYEPYSNAWSHYATRNLKPSDRRNVPLPSYQKDFYRAHTRTAQRCSAKVGDYRNANDLTVTGCDAPVLILHIDEAGLSESLTNAIQKLKSDSSLTALQAERWPVVLRRRDLVAANHMASK